MSKTTYFLSILSKIMKPNYQTNKECNAIYTLVNNDLVSVLNKAHYPKSSNTITSLNEMLNDLDSAFLCREFFGKTVHQIDGQFINICLKSIKKLFAIDISDICRIRTVVPYVISNSESFSVSVVNYDNNIIELSSLSDFKFLMEESYKNKIDITKLIRFVKITIPLILPDICLIVSTVNKRKMSDFSRFVSKKIICTVGEKNNNYKNISFYDAILSSSDENNNAYTPDTIIDFFDNDKKTTLFGFSDEFRYSIVELLSYYGFTIATLDKSIHLMKDDILRCKNKGNYIERIKELKKSEEEFKQTLLKESAELHIVISKIESELEKLCTIMQDKYTLSTIVQNRIYNCIFETIFCAVEYKDEKEALRCISRLKKLEYQDIEIVDKYENFIKFGSCTVFDIPKYFHWTKAKMLLAILDLDNIDPSILRELVSCLEHRGYLNTAKEYYAKALVAKSENNELYYINNLKISFEKGYTNAAIKLLELYKNGKKININFLVNYLIPEACMIKAEEEYKKSENKFANLSNPNMIYYKFAASKEYVPAIEKIVDIVFEERFSSAFQISGKEYDDPKYTEMKNNGHAICAMCQYLIEKKIKPKHYKEIKGVVMFCLNENLPYARQELSGINTPIANYCKGVMCEFGAERDFNKALEYYRKANGFRNSLKRISKLEEKIWYQEQEKNRPSYIDDEDDYYYSSKRSTSYDSFCFISTAACVALKKGDDCEELNTLRAFRDKYINSSEDGELLTLEYYRVAPIIVQHINALPDSEEEYYKLWVDYIKPSCTEIYNSEFDKAKRTYIKMVLNLCDRFNVTLDPEILNIVS